MKKVLVILGPTATGKTDLALKLAKKFNGELVAADSRQVYKGLDIGTGKIPGQFQISNFKFQIEKADKYWIINGIKVWLYDVVTLKAQYTVADYVQDANQVVEDILKRNKLPIIVGGTGLYLKALLEGLDNLAIPTDPDLRRELETLNLVELQEKFKKLSPIKWKELNNSDRQNPRRLLRSIELLSMNPYIKSNQKSKVKSQKWDVLKIGLSAPREVLYKKSNLRVVSWFGQGIIEEVRNLVEEGVPLNKFKELGLGYKLIAEYLENKIADKQELIGAIQNQIHGYVRRQQTWFKKDPTIKWFDITSQAWQQQVENLASNWYNK